MQPGAQTSEKNSTTRPPGIVNESNIDRGGHREPRLVSRDPLRNLNQLGRSFFRNLLTASPTTAHTKQDNSDKRATSADRPQCRQRQNVNATDGKSRSQVELADDDDDQMRTDCCLPLSHLIVQQQPTTGASSSSNTPLNQLVRLISDKGCEQLADGSDSLGGSKMRNDNWLNDLQAEQKIHRKQPPPIQQQPKSQQLRSSVKPQLVATDELSLPTAPIQSVQRGAFKRALSKGSRAGSRWSSGGEQKLDRMGKLISLLDKMQDVRRASLQQQQQQQPQSSVMGSQISDSTCDLPQVVPDSRSRDLDGLIDDSDLFYLEESWRNFVKLPSLSSATLANKPLFNHKTIVDVDDNDDDDDDEDNDQGAYLQQQHRANLKIQQDAIWELLTTEVFYIKRLRVIIDLFLATLIDLQQHSLLVEIDSKQVFSNIVEIYDANYSFWTNHLYPMLAKARSTRQPMDPVEMKNAFVQWCESQKDCERLRLMDLLAKPMQRLTRYSLLLRAISKKTDNQADLKSLGQMIANMNRFVLTVDLKLRRQEELEMLTATARRIESMEIGADVYNDEIDKLVKSYYCLFDLDVPLFNCPFKCHRQLLYDSQFFTRGLQLGQLRFKDAQTKGGKLEIVLLIFTDHLVICRQLGPVSRWHHPRSSASFTGYGGGQVQTGTSPGTSANRSPATLHRSPAGNGGLGAQLLAGLAGATGEPLRRARPRAGSHQTSSGSAQASLRVYRPQQHLQGQKQQQQQQTLSPRALSLILSPDACLTGSVGQVALDDGRAGASKQLGAGLSPGRAYSQTCISLSTSPKFLPHLLQQQQSLATAQSQLTASFAAASPACSRKSSGPSQRASLHASSSSLAGTMAREFFRRSAESSRSGDQQAEFYNLSSAATSGCPQGRPLVQPQTATEPHQFAHLMDSRLRVIRSPYPVERLVMHELKGGQGVFVCQLNDSRTIANSFVLYCSPPTLSSLSNATTQATSKAAHFSKGINNIKTNEASAVKRSSSDQQAVSGTGRGATGGQHLRLANSNQESSRSDSESQQFSVKCSRGDGDATNAGHKPEQASPVRDLMNLVKQAQACYQLAANYHEISLVSFEDFDDEPQQPEAQAEPHHIKSRLSTWSSFRQTRRSETNKIRRNRASAGLICSNLADSVESGAGDKSHREERCKLERRSESSEYQEGEQWQAGQLSNKRWYYQQPIRLVNPLSKALFEQQQSMLLNHGELENLAIGTESIEQVQLNSVPEARYGSSGLSVCGSDTGGPIGGDGAVAPRAGSQSSVFDEASYLGQRVPTLQAPLEKPRSFSSPTSPKRHPQAAQRERPTATGFNTLLEGQQLLSPNRYPSSSAHNWGSKISSGSQRSSSPTSGRRHFSRSSRVTGISQQPNTWESANVDIEQVAFRGPLSANESNKSVNSPGTSFTSSDSEFSSTRSSSPFVGQIGRQRHTESPAILWNHSPIRSSANRVCNKIVVPSSEGSDLSTSGPNTTSGANSQRRRNLSSLRRQNVILSASSDQQQCQESVVVVANNRRPSDIVIQRERRQQQLAAVSSWMSGANSSRDSSSMATTDAGPNTGHLAPSSGRHRQFLAHHAHHYQTSSSQATTVDQTNSAVFDSGDQNDPILPASQQHRLSTNSNNPGSNSFELGHLGSQKFSTCHYQHRNSCSCTDNGRSASMETRSPISVTLTLPNNEAALETYEAHLTSRATSPVFLNIPRLEAATRRALLSPIDSVAAHSPVADHVHDWNMEPASDGSWGSVAGDYVSGDERVPELNIITTTTTTTTGSSVGGQLERRRSSEALESLGHTETGDGAHDWPKVMIRRRSSSNEEMFNLSSEGCGELVPPKRALTSSREESVNFLRRFLPHFRRKNSTPGQNRTDQWLTKAKFDLENNRSQSPQETDSSDINCSQINMIRSTDSTGLLNEGFTGNDATHVEAPSGLSGTVLINQVTSGYLGFHEKLRLHDKRLEEERAAFRSASARHRHGKRPSTGHWKDQQVSNSLARHSTSSGCTTESRSFRALNLTRSVTGNLFGSFLRARSLRSLSRASYSNKNDN